MVATATELAQAIVDMRTFHDKFGEWHMDDDPDDILWTPGKVPSPEEKQRIRVAVRVIDDAFSPLVQDVPGYTNTINAGVWWAMMNVLKFYEDWR